MAENNLRITFEEFEKQVGEYKAKLEAMRADGSEKVKTLNFEIRRIKQNKYKSKEEKQRSLKELQKSLEEAKAKAKQDKDAIKALVKEAVGYINANYPALHSEKKDRSAKDKADAKAAYEREKQAIAEQYEKDLAALTANETDKEKARQKKNLLQRERRMKDFENKKLYGEKTQKAKDEVHASYLYRDELLDALTDGKKGIVVAVQNYIENYCYQFNLKKFLMKNGLYIIIVMFMIVCIFIKPSLISGASIWLILKNFSTKVFFALGVAGLILLAGTDLSVGRMVTLSTMITCMILNPNTDVKFFGISFNGIYASLGFGGALVVALVLSAVMCVLFSALAGFFSSKFKIHPFISTLGTSLIIWGLIGFGTNNLKTGTISDEALSIAGNIGPVPLTLIYAIIAIVVVWFIWNKTVFGKNMYAVGGNPEAASVSGISVFKVTMGVFIMAGVLYGLGGFFQATVTGSSSSSFGQGWELEAIAACVIGGISFTGGIGKISGAVIGCLLFEILKYYLRGVFGGSADISNIFIGIIILAAVTFDSIKYLKKK